MEEKAEMVSKKPLERDEAMEKIIREIGKNRTDFLSIRPYPGQYAYVPTYVSAGNK